MSNQTGIEWTDATWNPVTGCTPISPGCAHCYAKRMAKRLAGRCGYPAAPHEFDVTLHPEKLDEPLRWKKPRQVFVCSMSDLFHEAVPFEFVWRVYSVTQKAPQHIYQVLTKRPGRALEFYDWLSDQHCETVTRDWFSNVWLGVTAENQEQADARIPTLLRIPAAVRFVSVEPMLGQINLFSYLSRHKYAMQHGGIQWIQDRGLDWIVCGPETGPGARELSAFQDRARDLRDQCVEAGVAFFLKKNVDGTRLLDGREWSRFPGTRQ